MKDKFRIGILERWSEADQKINLVTVGKDIVPVTLAADVIENQQYLSEALDEGAIRPEIWAIEGGSTKNHNVYLAKRLSGGKPDSEGNPSGVASWYSPFAKPILINHDLDVDPVGRIRTSADARFMRRGANGGIMIYPTISQPEAVAKILRGEYLTGSIGVQSDSAVCSICGHDIVATMELCKHQKGRRYKGDDVDPKGNVAEWILGNLWFDEYSFVNRPAKSTSGIVKVNTKEAFQEFLGDKGTIVYSSEGKEKHLCYNCGACASGQKCTTEADEVFYLVKLKPVQSHFWMPSTEKDAQTDPATKKEDASMKNFVLIPAEELAEAKLSTKSRNALPDSAFCGPGRSYPAHDAAHVRNGLARLSQFGSRLTASTRAKILGCLRARAKKYGIKTGGSKEDGTMAWTHLENDAAVEWFDKRCEALGLTDALSEALKLTIECEEKGYCSFEWTEEEKEAIRNGERDELKATQEFLQGVGEALFCGPNRSFPVLNAEYAQVAKSILRWSATKEKLNNAQRASVLEKIEALEAQFDDKGAPKEGAVTLPAWHEAEDFVMMSELIEALIINAVEGFKQKPATSKPASEEQTPPPSEMTLEEAKAKIVELEGQVKTLTEQVDSLKDDVSLREEQIKQVRATAEAAGREKQELADEVKTLQEAISKLNAAAHGALVEQLVKFRKEDGDTRTEDELREHYSKLPADSLQHIAAELKIGAEAQDASHSDSSLPGKPAPAVEAGEPPKGDGITVENAGGDSPQKTQVSPAVERMQAAAARTGASSIEASKDQA